MAGLGKRQMERFNLSIPAVVSLKNQTGSASSTQAGLTTRNVCAGGAFISTDDAFHIGTEVEVSLQLAFFTGSLEYDERKSNIRVSGSVIRVEPGGMAIQFNDKYQIHPILETTSNS